MEYLHSLLKFAVNMGASDIHVKPEHHATIRISGELFPVQVDPPTKEQVAEIVKFMLPKHLESRLEREKEADFSYIDPSLGRFRVNVFYQRGLVSFAMRFVKTKVPSFKELNLPQQLGDIATAERGIILVTGPTGCGKSSTLAAMVQYINENEKCHIITLEDPIEYIFDDKQSVIEQREVGLDTLSFERALVHVMRQDPDVIMIGEMRDATSFTAAMAAADTGHLVLSTLHTTNASQAVHRILDFFKADERDQIRRQIAGTLQAVVCQRMVPTIAGGMTPAQEIMINSGTVRKLIEENRLERLAAAIETGSEEGMLNFNQSLFNLVKDGKVSQADALAKATNAQALEMNFQGIFLTEGKRILG